MNLVIIKQLEDKMKDRAELIILGVILAVIGLGWLLFQCTIFQEYKILISLINPMPIVTIFFGAVCIAEGIWNKE